MRTILFLLAFISYAFAFDWQSSVVSSDFSEESHPGNDSDAQDNIRNEGSSVGFIRNGNWMKFANFDFGTSPGVTNFGIDASKGNTTNSSLEVRLDSLTGPVIGSIEITNTGEWWIYRRFNLFFSQNITGIHDLYFTCVGGNDYLFNLGTFRFKTGGHSRQTDIASGEYSVESHPNDLTNIRRVSQQIQNIRDGNWVAYRNFDFGDRAEYLWIKAATANAGGTISFRLGSPSGAVLGSVNITSTGGWSSFKPFGCKMSVPINGIQDLYLTFSGGTGDLFNLANFRFQRLAPDYKPPGNIVNWVKRDVLKTFSAGAFTSESHPTDQDTVRSENGTVGYIKNGSWVRYADFDFGTGASHLTIQASSADTGGTVEVRLGNPTTGTLLGSVAIVSTGSWQSFWPSYVNLSQTVVGVQDLYFRFVNTTSTAYLFDIREFVFQNLPAGVNTIGRVIGAAQFSQESNPGGEPVVTGPNGISELPGGSWASYENFNFDQGANLVTVMAATPNKGGTAEMRLDSLSGPRIATLDITHTGSWTLFREYTVALSQTITGTRNLFVRFVDTNNQSGSLLNLKEFIFENKAVTPLPPSNEGALIVYDPVTGLAPSPYYTYSVQKVSDLNAPLKQNATNWLSPFAWFSECKGYSDPYNTAYFSNEIAGWSHTYCNFELGKNTPIVIKITRTPNPFGAPSGSIFMANVHPAHKVQSCEIINGEVYVTMKEPALVTVDIDGQMDARDAPRISPAELASSKPYASREKGSHAVSIFANPVIEDAPVIGAPGVRFIAAGDPLPAFNDPSWTTLYFGKGVHDLGHIPYFLMSNKSYYIPGDAMVYGSFDGASEPSSKENLRVYGYGTLSCVKIPHFNDAFWNDPALTGLNRWLSGIKLSSGYNCRFEGVTLVDPANHGVAFDNGWGNIRRWMKQVSWRANSDMGGIPGIIEDCFFRLQDDGPYVSGNDFRRNTLWFDCNGSPFRGTFIRSGTYAAGDQTIVEDCDIIYVRSNWAGTVISAGDYWEIGTYPDGTKNTAQHVIFRNIRVTDPRPTRALFGLERGMAGMRFENIEYRHPHSWGYQSNFSGTATEPMSHCYFDGVFVEGRKMDAPLVADPTLFQSSNISDFVFRDAPNVTPSTYNLLTSATTGSITLNPPGGIYDPGTVVTVTAVPDSGFLFDSWSGDLTGTTNPTTLVMDGNKSITANMGNSVLPRNGWVASASSSNGSPANAIDGNIGTRWSTGANQTNGQWFRVDMGAARTFNRIVLDAGSSAGDYPRGYQVHVSNDGLDWGIPVATGAGSSGVTTITFATQTARYIRVTQTGSVSSMIWWSIHEFNVYGPAYTLIETSPNGSVAFNPPGLTYLAGTVVTVTAVPDSNYAFNGWGGDLTGTTNPTTVTMTGNKSVTANFAPATTGYDVWARTNSVSGGAPEDDPDGDGIKNLLEYVLGGDPRKSSTGFLPKAAIEGTDLVLTYKRNDDSETDTTQAGQWSTDLQTWSDVDVAIELTNENGTDPDDMKISIPMSKATNDRLYGRLQVIKP